MALALSLTRPLSPPLPLGGYPSSARGRSRRCESRTLTLTLTLSLALAPNPSPIPNPSPSPDPDPDPNPSPNPNPNHQVWIQPGQRILYDVSSPRLYMLIIQVKG